MYGDGSSSFAGVNTQSPAPAPVVIVQKPSAAELVRAAFKDNKIVIKKNQNNRAI